MWRTPSGDGRALRDPRDRDVVRRDRRRGRHRSGRCCRRSSPRRPTCTPASAGWCPRSRRAGIWSSSRPVIREALETAGAGSTTSSGSPSRKGPVWSARCSSGSRRKGARLGAAAAARAGRPSPWPRRLALPAARPPSSRRSLCLLASGGHTLLLDGARARVVERARHRRSTTPPVRRSTRARGCSGSAIPGGAAIDRLAARAIPRRSRSPSRGCPGSTSRSPGLKTALLYAVRELEPDELDARRADLAASYQRAIVAGADRAATRGRGRRPGSTGWPSSAASRRTRELRAALPDARARAARALHRQRGHDRVGGPLRAPCPYPESLALDAYATVS